MAVFCCGDVVPPNAFSDHCTAGDFFFTKRMAAAQHGDHSLNLTANAPENRPSQKETSILTIYFQGRKC